MRTALLKLSVVVAFGALAAASVVQAGPREPAGVCGGPHGHTCPENHYCKIDGPMGVDRSGICVERPRSCPRPMGHEAVCGRNGQTYPSRCFAAKAGVNVASDGPCRRTWRP